MSTLTRRPDKQLPSWASWLPTSPFADWLGLPDLGAQFPIKVEEFRDGDHLVVRAELPGIDPADVDITLLDHVLQIRAERHQEERTESETGFRSEFRYGSFARSIRLPADATEDDIEATYKDGILQVRVPVGVAESEPTRIAVTRP